MIYFFVVLLLLFLVYHYDIQGKKRRLKFWYNFVLIIFILIAGLRYRLGIDTLNYTYHFYHDVPLIREWDWDNITIASDPLFVLLNSIVLSLDGYFYIVQLVQAAFVNILLFLYIKKHSPYIYTCVFFYFLWEFFAYNMEIMRAGMAIVICLYANDYVLQKKYVKCILLYLLASLFHFSAIVFILTPFFMILRFDVWGVLLIFFSFISGVFVSTIIEGYLPLLNAVASDKMEMYLDDGYSLADNLNIFGYILKSLIYFFPVIALCCYKKQKIRDSIIIFEPFIVAGLILAAFSLKAFLVERLVDYYVVYFIFLISHFSIYQIQKDRAYLKNAIVILLLVAFVSRELISDISRYYPYSSVIEKSIDRQREVEYSKHFFHNPAYDEY